MIEFDYKKLEFWVFPIFILICLLNETLNKAATIIFVLVVLAIQFNNNHFANQRTFRINRRIHRRSRRRNMVRTVPPKHRTVPDSNTEKEIKKSNRYNLTLGLKDIEEQDSDSIHSFDLEDINNSVSSSLSLFDQSFLQDDSLLDSEIERFLTPWGQNEFQNFQQEIKCVKRQENGLFLTDEEISSWRKKYPRFVSKECSKSVSV